VSTALEASPKLGRYWKATGSPADYDCWR